MSEQAGSPRPDVEDMYAVHGVFRDLLGATPELVGAIEPGDAERVALIANYYENILSFLEAHHDGEEKLSLPLLCERCTGQGALFDQMERQHEEALALLGEAKSSLAAWPGGDAAAQKAAAQTPGRAAHPSGGPPRRGGDQRPAPGRRQPLHGGMGALPEHGMAYFHGDKIWLILGLIRKRMNDEQRAAMLEQMPPPAVDMWTGFGEQAFKDYSSVVVVEVVGR